MKKKIELPKPAHKLNLSYNKKSISGQILLSEAFKKFTKYNTKILVHGGRKNALKVLNNAIKTQTHYSRTHNDLEKNTSLLSAYIKFGCVSIREVYKSFKSKHDLIRQLIWRDFYANILFSFPYVLGSAMKPKYNTVKWHHNSKWFEA